MTTTMMKNMNLRFSIVFTACLLLALVFLSAGIGKVLGQGAYLLTINAGMPTGMETFISEWLPWVEIVLGTALLLGITAPLASLISCVLAVVFMFQNIWSIYNRLAYEP